MNVCICAAQMQQGKVSGNVSGATWHWGLGRHGMQATPF